MISNVFEDDSIVVRPTVVEVDLDALAFNIAGIRKRVGSRLIMGTVKANAYGHGLVRIARELLSLGVDQLGVAFLEEGITLRRAGITAPILVLGGIIGNQIQHFLDYNLQLTASSVYKLRQIEEIASQTGQQALVHLKLDTGMGRIGIRSENAGQLFEAAVSAPHVRLVGVFSHFANSHAKDRRQTELQLQRFHEALEFFPRSGLPMPLQHIANSGAVLQHPESLLDMVRTGVIMYGVYPDAETEKTIPLKPVLTFKTRVVYFKVVAEGQALGYDGTWTAARQTRIVTLPVGYGDGYFRALSNKGSVLIHGNRYPIAGSISMDQCMVDIGEASAYNDDEVVLIGPQGSACITCEEIASLTGTIPYEVLTNINTRVPRKYYRGGVQV